MIYSKSSQFATIEPLLRQLDTNTVELMQNLVRNAKNVRNKFTLGDKWKEAYLNLNEKIKALPLIDLTDHEKVTIKASLDLSKLYIDEIKKAIARESWFFQNEKICDNDAVIFLLLDLKDLVSMKRVSKKLHQIMNVPETKNCLLKNQVALLNAKKTIPIEWGMSEEALINEFGEEHCKNIQVLDLDGFSNTLNLEKISKSFPNLTELALYSLGIDEGRVSNLSAMKTLQKLTLTNCNDHSLTGWGSRRYHAVRLDCSYLQNLSALKTLCIAHKRSLTIKWPEFSSIEHLVIDCNQRFYDMSFVKSFPLLKSLSINNCRFLEALVNMSDADLEKEVKGHCPQFETLNITNRKEGDVSMLSD